MLTYSPRTYTIETHNNCIIAKLSQANLMRLLTTFNFLEKALVNKALVSYNQDYFKQFIEKHIVRIPYFEKLIEFSDVPEAKLLSDPKEQEIQEEEHFSELM